MTYTYEVTVGNRSAHRAGDLFIRDNKTGPGYEVLLRTTDDWVTLTGAPRTFGSSYNPVDGGWVKAPAGTHVVLKNI